MTGAVARGVAERAMVGSRDAVCSQAALLGDEELLHEARVRDNTAGQLAVGGLFAEASLDILSSVSMSSS
jgi:hypothetical protein